MEPNEVSTERLLDAKVSSAETIFDVSLRPKRLEEYIGQEKVKENLKIFMEAAQKRNEPIEHVLLYGPPGLGKTTLGYIIASEMMVNIKVTSGPAIEKSGDLAAILTNLRPGDVLFIDEIHRLNKVIEEVLYPAMEDFKLDIIIGKGPSARTLRLNLPKFTLIGATTKFGQLSSPLRDRFGNVYHLDFYSPEEIAQIITRSAHILNINIDADAITSIAARSRRTPRIANRLLKRARDYAQVRGNGNVKNDVVAEALEMLEIDHLGLDAVDRKLLGLIIEKFAGGPVGLSALAAASVEEVDTIEDVYEPYLMQLGFLNRTPRGRVATHLAYEHLKIQKSSALASLGI
jgi:Holliday junction DNA helicase RuvB